MIYLDNAATTMMHEYVVRDMLPYLYGEYGNPSAIYKFGRTADAAVQKARQQVADFLHTTPEHIIFTSGGSEGNNTILRGVARYLKKIGKPTIVTTPIEHPSCLRVVDSLIKDGFYIRFLPITTQGIVDYTELENYIQDDVGLVSVMWVNNETGAINPVEDIARICHEKGILFHSDCVQAAAAFDINVEDAGFDFITLSSHKLHGPKGVGAIYVRDIENTEIMEPLIIGGQDQEFGRRGGTENVAGVVGFGRACELMEYPQNFRSLFLYELQSALAKYDQNAKYKIYVNGFDNTTGHILNLEIQDVDAETLVLLMDSQGVCISAGSACHSHSVEPSHVLKAMGLSDKEARCSVRISVSSYQSEEDIITAAHIMAGCIYNLIHADTEVAEE